MLSMTSSQLARPLVLVLAAGAGAEAAGAASWAAATAGVGVVGRSRAFFLGAMVVEAFVVLGQLARKGKRLRELGMEFWSFEVD